MQPLDAPEGRFGLGTGSAEESSVQEERLGHEQHQREHEPHCHHRGHPPIGDREKSIPQIESNEHVEASEPDDRRREARLSVETPLHDLEKGDPLPRGFEISYRRQQYRRHECHAPDPATASANPAFLYLDRVVGILPERHLNDGQPSLHAKLIAEASPQAGEHVVHIGAGTGYYTAIMAHLVGPSGKVTGIELDPGLAERARDNLSSYPDVDVVCGNGAVVPFETADVYADRPRSWFTETPNMPNPS